MEQSEIIVSPAYEAWTELRQRLIPFIARRVAAENVDDVVQEVFERILRNMGTLREDERWVSWVFVIARNVITDHHRARHGERDAGVDADSLPGPDPAQDDATYAATAACAARFVSLLPSPYREALEMTDLAGVSQRDAAARLGVSYSGLKSRVQRGRERLRALLVDCCAIELDARRRVVDCRSPTGCGTDAVGCGVDPKARDTH